MFIGGINCLDNYHWIGNPLVSDFGVTGGILNKDTLCRVFADRVLLQRKVGASCPAHGKGAWPQSLCASFITEPSCNKGQVKAARVGQVAEHTA